MSNEQAASGLAPHVLTNEDLWALTTYDFEVTKGPGGRPCVFKLRRTDLLTLLMEDTVNAPLLTAAMTIIQEVQDWLNADASRSFESAFQNLLTTEKKRTVLDQMRDFACKTVLQPKLTLDPAADPHAFPVTMLSAETLFAIWNHKPDAATVPRLSEVAAEDFRPAVRDDAGVAASPGEELRVPAVDVDPQPAPAGQS